ncbi:adenylate/guanylate cyclase domain-containing protein [Paraburkholderia oxyphila]|uniref:adenylate/guanylate cyclase domain-containing protein n=1 Tax=Paraburkholderia oxyphila TaxID=614212 RepID=UPI0004862D7F|nr:adenylate/guanylate cyclase domain-containing protein [Paraburkholderia oxyphila]
MRCADCGFENAAGAHFCEQCGMRLARLCSRCGHELSASARFCNACGAPASGAPSSDASSGGAPLGDAGHASPAAPIHYTPPHLAQRILAEQAAIEAQQGTAVERKTITALFADMAGSTALIHERDPEDAHRLIAPVIALMMEAVHHYEGFVAKSLGDGILALFGAPIAHEDHPQRALYAALRMQETMRRHADRIRLQEGIPLQIRVGVHTGEVVVRSIRKDDLRTDYDPVGHTIHIASRMQTIAALSSVLVSESTYRLTTGYFEFKALGATQIKGIQEPLEVFELTGLGALRTRLQVAAHRGLARFVGRETELERLHGALALTTAGHGQIVGVVGEAGVGKSRLFHEFKERSQRGCLILETFSVSHGKAFPYLPLIELLRNYFQITAQDDERRSREKVTGRVLTLERGLEDLLPYVLYLLGAGEPDSAVATMDARIRRERTFDAIKRLIERESLNQPVQLLFEDLQWLDSETEAFLAFLIEHVASERIILLLNFRPDYRPGWSDKDNYRQMRLDALGPAEAQSLLSALLGDDPGLMPLKERILEKTEGNPFFMEEVVQTLVEEGALLGAPGQYRIAKTPAELHIPTTVHGVLASRMDRLPVAEKTLLQHLAIVGKEFPWSLIRQVVEQTEDELRHLLSRLQVAEFIYERPAFPEIEYTFKHALTQEVAASSLLSEQRSLLHERTAQAIEALYAGRLNEYCSELAHHYSLSSNAQKAVEYLHRAGQQAVERSAGLDAMRHFQTALALLERLPDTPGRARQELALRLSIGPALMAARGYAAPEVEATYTRAMALCEQIGDCSQLFPARFGLRTYYSLRADYATAQELGERLLRVASNAHDPDFLVEAHSALGSSSFFQGDFVTAREHQEKMRALYVQERHQAHAYVYGMDPGVRTLSIASWTQWYLGFPDQASERSRQALTLARKIAQPFGLAFALVSAAMLHLIRQEPRQAQEFTEAAITLSDEQGFPYYLAWATILHGSSLAEQGNLDGGIEQMKQGLAAYLATGAKLSHSYFLGLLASACGRNGREREGLDTLAEALAIVDQTGEHFHEAELHRIRGELLLERAGDRTCDEQESLQAEACFQKALAIAAGQRAMSLQLRAGLSLARLWRAQRKTGEAGLMLSRLYEAFSEGADTVDLQQAKALLGDMATERSA